MTLKDELKEIRGIGEAKADAILDVLAEHDTGGVDPELEDAIRTAHEALEVDNARQARKFTTKAMELLDG